jgi:DNA-binding CsgD family transcriptional regulator
MSMIPDVLLSKREKDVLKLVLQGKSNKQIALALDITVRTVEFHLKNVYAKFQVSSRIELVLKLGHTIHLLAPYARTGVPRTEVPGATTKIEELGYSTVEMEGEKAENGGRSYPQMDWTTFSGAVSIIGKELIMKVILKNPSAFLPLAMSFGALTTVLIYVAMFGPAPQADEGTAAHIWQILMAGQMPIILFFAIKWLPRTPKEALLVLMLQGGAALMALAPVYLLRF